MKQEFLHLVLRSEEIIPDMYHWMKVSYLVYFSFFFFSIEMSPFKTVCNGIGPLLLVVIVTIYKYHNGNYTTLFLPWNRDIKKEGYSRRRNIFGYSSQLVLLL